MSTIFVSLDIDGSDIDVACSYENDNGYINNFIQAFLFFQRYSLEKNSGYILGSLFLSGFEIEIYASYESKSQQLGYRHYKTMERLVYFGGEQFQSEIFRLKRAGHKTEPVICSYLSLEGDPYEVILQVELWSDKQLNTKLLEANSAG